MKKFILILAASSVIGGFVGAEVYHVDFSITGAVIGFVGVGVAIIGLGAYLEAQERKKKQKEIPPEVRAVFDRMFSAVNTKEEPISLDLGETLARFIAEDANIVKSGGIPERRLFLPHYQMMRDILLLGYEKDFSALSPTMQDINMEDYKKQISIIMGLGPDDLNKSLALRGEVRNDLAELESILRRTREYYRDVPNLFIKE